VTKLGVDWHALARHPVIRTTLLLFCATTGVGCGGSEEAAPVTAARAFASAAQRGDVKAMLPLIEQRAVERLQQAAERASDHVGGRRVVDAREMLQVVDVDSGFQVARAELIVADQQTAQVRLVTADGREQLIDLVHEDGAWRVRLALPPLTAPQES
jgi:hypothetical protein